MKKIIVIILLFSFIIILGCKTETSPDGVAVPIVYTAGYEYNASNKKVAKYWKNNQEFSLTDGTNEAAAYSIFVAGSDVYVAGNEGKYAKYWKNGISVSLTDGTKNAVAFSIFINSGDIYVAGFEFNGSSTQVAKYWKNGIAVSLTDGTKNAIAKSIFISQGNVYVAGYENDSTKSTAIYWENGVRNDLNTPTANIYVEAASIFVSGSDIYVSGYEDDGTTYRAKYWKNGTLNLLSESTTTNLYANSIFVVNNNLYIAGSQFPEAVLWTNGIAAKLLPDTVTDALSVYVDKSDVYVAGYRGNDFGKDIAVYWKNNEKIELTDGSKSARANSIYIGF